MWSSGLSNWPSRDRASKVQVSAPSSLTTCESAPSDTKQIEKKEGCVQRSLRLRKPRKHDNNDEPNPEQCNSAFAGSLHRA